MVTPASDSRPRDDASETRAQAPIRWPHFNATSVGLALLWAVGVFVAIFVPAFIVSPSVRTASSAVAFQINWPSFLPGTRYPCT